MIRIERVTLPSGLRAVARRDDSGNLVIYVAAELDSRQQRTAVLEAVRASRRAGWRAALPIWIGLAAGLRFWLRRLQSLVRAQPAGWATGVGAVAAGAVVAAVLLTSPGSHSPLASGGPTGGSITGPAGQGQPGGHGHRPAARAAGGGELVGVGVGRPPAWQHLARSRSQLPRARPVPHRTDLIQPAAGALVDADAQSEPVLDAGTDAHPDTDTDAQADPDP